MAGELAKARLPPRQNDLVGQAFREDSNFHDSCLPVGRQGVLKRKRAREFVKEKIG